MKHFVPVTDDQLYETPTRLREPLVPYQPGMPCVHQARPAAREQKPQRRGRHHAS